MTTKRLVGCLAAATLLVACSSSDADDSGDAGQPAPDPPTVSTQGDCPTDEEIAAAPAVGAVLLAEVDGFGGGTTFEDRTYSAVITDQAGYDALPSGSGGTALPFVDFSTHQVLVAAASTPASCAMSFSPNSWEVVEIDGAPHLEARWSTYHLDCCLVSCAMEASTAILVQVPAAPPDGTVCVRYESGCGYPCEQ